MKNYNMILTEKLQRYQHLSTGIIDKFEYLTGEEILSINQSQIIEHAKFTYSPLGKTVEKQMKAIKKHGDKQKEAIYY